VIRLWPSLLSSPSRACSPFFHSQILAKSRNCFGHWILSTLGERAGGYFGRTAHGVCLLHMSIRWLRSLAAGFYRPWVGGRTRVSGGRHTACACCTEASVAAYQSANCGAESRARWVSTTLTFGEMLRIGSIAGRRLSHKRDFALRYRATRPMFCKVSTLEQRGREMQVKMS